MKREWMRPLFEVAALYDFLLGLLFLVAWARLYRLFGIEPPNHPAYIQFAAALVTTFGVGFWFVSRAPERNRDIIKLGILLKLSYAGIVLGYWFQGRMPLMWVPFAWIDLAFMLAFIASLAVVRPVAAAGRA